MTDNRWQMTDAMKHTFSLFQINEIQNSRENSFFIMPFWSTPKCPLLLGISLLPTATNADVFINEVSDKGTGTVCDGEDWAELYNDDSTDVSLSGYILFDDNGPLDSNAYSFSSDASIPAGGYLLLCCNGDGVSSPAFKIGGDDALTLRDGSDVDVDSTGVLPDAGEFDVTYVRNADGDGDLVQTITPTPGMKNVITPKPPMVDVDYRAQNALGLSFFGMSDSGESVPGVDAVVDVHAKVDASDWDYLKSNPYAETYIPVQEFKVVSSGGTHVLSSPGRMRPRGQSTLVYPICMDEDAIPFKLDFANTNATQTLFGVETAYLRTHLGDISRMREWVMHRLLARFGLPHLRTRHVRFYVNGKQLGFYTFMEAPDQDYVMARTYNYAAYDKDHSALYKVKTMSLFCGEESSFSAGDPGYPEKCTSTDGADGYDCFACDDWNEPQTCAPGYSVKKKEDCWYTCVKDSNEDGTGPYAYERGDHRDEVSVNKNEGKCLDEFWETIYSEITSVARAFFDAGYTSVDDCGDFLLSYDLVDRDLGQKEWDSSMKDFINTHLSTNGQCRDNKCSDKRGIKDKIDMENWLKNFAVYAVVVEQDSPMGNGNNYFLATAGNSTLESPQWKIVPYDHNNDAEVASILCDFSCTWNRIDDWSIARPTCRGLSENPLVGPLLLDSEIHAKYMSYVREFVENVYTNESLLSDMEEHIAAIKSTAIESPDSDTYGSIDASRLLEWMEKRSRNVLKQLDKWDKGEFPERASVDSVEVCVSASMKVPAGTIVGIVVGSILGLLLAILGIVCYRKRVKREQEQEQEKNNFDDNPFAVGNK